MSAPALAPRGEERRIWPGGDQVVLRALAVAGILVALVAAESAGAQPEAWVEISVVGLAAVAAFRPDSVAAVVALVGVAYAWGVGPDPLSPLVLLAAAGMVLTHVCLLVAAQGPGRMRVALRQVGTWLRRGVLLWLAALAVWAVALLVEDHPGGRTTYAVGLLLLAAVAVVGTREVSRRIG